MSNPTDVAFILKLSQIGFTDPAFADTQSKFFRLLLEKLKLIGINVESVKQLKTRLGNNFTDFNQYKEGEEKSNFQLLMNNKPDELFIIHVIPAIAKRFNVAIVVIDEKGSVHISKPETYGARVLYLAKFSEGNYAFLHNENENQLSEIKGLLSKAEIIEGYPLTPVGTISLSQKKKLSDNPGSYPAPEQNSFFSLDQLRELAQDFSPDKQLFGAFSYEPQFNQGSENILKVDDQRLREKLGDSFEIQKILGMGACGYYSIIHQLLVAAHKDEEITIPLDDIDIEKKWRAANIYLRECVYQHVVRNFEKNEYAWSLDTPKELLRGALNPEEINRWITEIELFALAQILKRTIVVIDDLLPKPIIFKPKNSLGVIYLGRTEPNKNLTHYVSLTVKNQDSDLYKQTDSAVVDTPELEDEILPDNYDSKKTIDELVEKATKPFRITKVSIKGPKRKKHLPLYEELLDALENYQPGDDHKVIVDILNKAKTPEQKAPILNWRTEKNQSFFHVVLFNNKFDKALADEFINFGFKFFSQPGNLSIPELIYNQSADVVNDLFDTKEAEFKQGDEVGFLPIHYAAIIGDREIIKKIVARLPAQINDTNNPPQKSPLQLLLENGHIELANSFCDSQVSETQDKQSGKIEILTTTELEKCLLEIWQSNFEQFKQLHPYYQKLAVPSIKRELQNLIDNAKNSLTIDEKIDYKIQIEKFLSNLSHFQTSQPPATHKDSGNSSVAELLLKAFREALPIDTMLFSLHLWPEVIELAINAGIPFPSEACRSAYQDEPGVFSEAFNSVQENFLITGENGYLPLFYAVAGRKLENVKQILQQFPAQINDRNNPLKITPVRFVLSYFIDTNDHAYLAIADTLLELGKQSETMQLEDQDKRSQIMQLGNNEKTSINLLLMRIFQELADNSQQLFEQYPNLQSYFLKPDEKMNIEGESKSSEGPVTVVEKTRKAFYENLSAHLKERMPEISAELLRAIVIESLEQPQEDANNKNEIQTTLEQLRNINISPDENISQWELDIIQEIFQIQFKPDEDSEIFLKLTDKSSNPVEEWNQHKRKHPDYPYPPKQGGFFPSFKSQRGEDTNSSRYGLDPRDIEETENMLANSDSDEESTSVLGFELKY